VTFAPTLECEPGAGRLCFGSIGALLSAARADIEVFIERLPPPKLARLVLPARYLGSGSPTGLLLLLGK